jgi:NAD-dependent dihydropyrimidine dehydrogenase PreA subunit
MDPDGDVLTYSWVVDGAEVSTDVSFTTDLTSGTYTYSLSVFDGEFTATDDVSIVVYVFVTPPDIVINEIMYNSPGDDNEWVELYNAGSESADLEGFILLDDDDGHTPLTIPAGYTIPAAGYFTIVVGVYSPPLSFTPDYDAGEGNYNFGLGNGGDVVRFFSNTGVLLDAVDYDDGGDWPGAADGDGPTLELIDVTLDNSLPASWQASYVDGGTPGAQNSTEPCTATTVTFNLVDSYGDSWNGNNLLFGEDVLTVAEGSDASFEYCLEDGAYPYSFDGAGSYQSECSWTIVDDAGEVIGMGLGADGAADYTFAVGEVIVWGCTNPDAINYDPEATDDDGSCYFSGDQCDVALDGGTINGGEIAGSTTEAYDLDWYSFVVDVDYDEVIVSLCGSDFDTKLEVWDACGAETYIGYNDDSCGLQSELTFSDLVAGTYYAKVYAYGSGFGNYFLNITGTNAATAPVLTAVAGDGAIDLAWDGVPVLRNNNTISHKATTLKEMTDKVSKQNRRNTVEFINLDTRAPYTLTVGGGSWDDEITWNISATDGTVLYTDAAGTFAIDLDDGTYMFAGFDSYGDGWNGALATLVDDAGATQFSFGLDAGSEFTETFSVPSGDVYGCTDPDALNFNPDATIDDGSCEYTAPANDVCEDAEVLTLPAAGEGTNLGATIDCEGVLDWNATWYTFDLPYDFNQVTYTLQGVTEDMANAGIILMDDCNCDDYIVSSFTFTEGVLTCVLSELPAGTYLLPAMAQNGAGQGIDFAYTVSVVEEVAGCTDPNASNYNPDATIEDGSCEYDCDYTTVTFNLYDSFGDGWVWGETTNHILFGEDVLYLEAGSEGSFIYCLEDGDYAYSFVEDASYASENSWTVELDDGTVLSSGLGSDGTADYTFNVGTEPFAPNFDIYRDGELLVAGYEGNAYADASVDAGIEYCYTVLENFEDETTSDMSNEACAMIEASGCDNYFETVWSGNGFDHMNFYVFSATIDGVNVGDCDEIAVFDGDYCVGTVHLDGPIEDGGYADFVASKDDPDTEEIDGYTPGNPITWKIWD